MTRCGLLMILVVLSGCKRAENSDYRDAFVGEYIGIRTTSSWIMGGPSNSSEMSVTVTVSSVGDSMIRVDATEVLIREDGLFFESPFPSNYFSVRFFGEDSLETDLNSGGLGGGNHSHFLGKRR